jgi:NAD(P)H-dependent flavin oxidoreductase YrpB (nitropropane dioxygenase family)
MIGSGYASTKAIKEELAEAGNARVGIGFILWALERNPAALDVALDTRPVAVMLSFGDPSPFTARIKEAGYKIVCQVQTLTQAKQAAEAGADIIIAQGRDAGGHSGTTRGTTIYPGRALKNAFSAEWHGREDELAASQAEVEKQYLATARNDISRGAVWAGESVDLVKDIPSAAEIIERTIAQAAAVLRQGAHLVRD